MGGNLPQTGFQHSEKEKKQLQNQVLGTIS